MISRILTVCSWFGSDRPGFFSGTLLLVVVMLSLHAAGIQASLSLGPDGNLPRLRDIFLFALSHDDAPSLLVNVCCLLLVGPCQERRWGTVAFLGLAAVSWAAVPCAYSLVLWVGVGNASRVCGYSAVQLALFTAQCRQVKGRRLGCVPVWLLPWTALLLALLLLPGTTALLHFCAICIGHNYSVHFIGTLQELERFSLVPRVPEWAFISSFSRIRLPTHSTSHRSSQPSEPGPPVSSYHPFSGTGPGMDLLQPEQSSGWSSDHFHHGVTEVEVLEEQMFRAGILASLQDYPDSAYSLGSSHFPETTSGDRYSLQEDPLDSPQAKVELPKSSVSSLRLQQLQRMGFCTEKAVVALAASKQLEGAVSLLVHDSIGPEAVVVGAAAPGPSPHR